MNKENKDRIDNSPPVKVQRLSTDVTSVLREHNPLLLPPSRRDHVGEKLQRLQQIWSEPPIRLEDLLITQSSQKN
jgi:hypothetical protein